MESKKIKYIIITPVRNEEGYIQRTLQSVISQTLRPAKWIIINDGSTDRTEDLVRKYSQRYHWIQLVNKEDRGFRMPGGEFVLESGIKLININDYDFIARLDGDISFEENYFAELFDRFKEMPKLGIAGGVIHNLVDNVPVLEKAPGFHVRGATKVYRRECWNDIGGLKPNLGWDTIDELKANMLGWTSRSFPELKVIHYRKTGAMSRLPQLNMGKAAYFIGYHPIFIIVKSILCILKKPFLLGSLGLIYGFCIGYIRKSPRLDDRELIQYLRKQQINRILFRETMWK